MRSAERGQTSPLGSSASPMRRRLRAATWIGGMLQTCDEKNVEKFAKSLRKSYLCNELKDRTLN